MTPTIRTQDNPQDAATEAQRPIGHTCHVCNVVLSVKDLWRERCSDGHRTHMTTEQRGYCEPCIAEAREEEQREAEAFAPSGRCDVCVHGVPYEDRCDRCGLPPDDDREHDLRREERLLGTGG